jgi:hypothetical protein
MKLSSFIGSDGAYPTIGLTAVNRARSAGLSDSSIKDMALEENLSFGPRAKETLNITDRAEC